MLRRVLKDFGEKEGDIQVTLRDRHTGQTGSVHVIHGFTQQRYSVDAATYVDGEGMERQQALQVALQRVSEAMTNRPVVLRMTPEQTQAVAAGQSVQVDVGGQVVHLVPTIVAVPVAAPVPQPELSERRDFRASAVHKAQPVNGVELKPRRKK